MKSPKSSQSEVRSTAGPSSGNNIWREQQDGLFTALQHQVNLRGVVNDNTHPAAYGNLNITNRHSHNPNEMFSSLASLQPRQLAAQVLNFALVLSTAFMLWKGLSVFTNSSSPIVVVLSGSMEPAFERGDLLFLWNRGLDTQVGEIVVYNVRGKDIPIVHRVIRRFGGGYAGQDIEHKSGQMLTY